MLSVYLCARFQVNSKEYHLTTIKHIFGYLNETKDFGLWYPRDNRFDLISLVDRKSIFISCQF